MTVVFDENGHASVAGTIRVFHYVSETGEYRGWSDEYIPVGVSLPGSSTPIDPGDEIVGHAWVFDGKAWSSLEDHRGEIVYSTDTRNPVKVVYLGAIRDGFTTLAPATPYDKWDGSAWITDTDAQHAADVAATEQTKQNLLAAARSTISIWQTELQLGSISEEDKNQLIAWLAYIKAVQAIDTSTAPEINWPVHPEV